MILYITTVRSMFQIKVLNIIHGIFYRALTMFNILVKLSNSGMLCNVQFYTKDFLLNLFALIDITCNSSKFRENQ